MVFCVLTSCCFKKGVGSETRDNYILSNTNLLGVREVIGKLLDLRVLICHQHFVMVCAIC